MRNAGPRGTNEKAGPREMNEKAGPARPFAGRFDRETRAVLVWMLAGFVIRLLLAWRVEHVITPDGVEYVRLGRSLLAGDLGAGLSAYFPPLYPLLVGLASLVFADAEFAGRFVSVVAGSLLVLPAHRLIREWYGERVALVGAALVALHPVLVYYSTVVLTEATYALLFTCGVLAGWRALNGVRARAYVLAGVIFGACYLLKPEAAGFVLLLILIVACRKIFDRARPTWGEARNALGLFAGFFLVAETYIVCLRVYTGVQITLSGKTAGHILQGRRVAGEATPHLAGALPGLTEAAVQLMKAMRYEYELFNLLFPVVFVLLAALGLFRERWTRERARREAYLLAFILATLAGYAVTLPNIRFLVPLVPLVLCWASRGLVEFSAWAGETLQGFEGARKISARARGLLVPLGAAALILSLVPVTFYLLRGDKWGDYGGQKRAAAWIKERDAAPVVMSTVPVAAFYARARHVRLVDEEYAAFIARARSEGARYVVVNQREFKHMTRLRTLLEEAEGHPGLRLAHSFVEGPGHKVLVYALEEEGPREARER